MKFFVSRQHYLDGRYLVEVAVGGRDFANPDMLMVISEGLGDGKEFFDPREAVEKAIELKDTWQRICSDKTIELGCGATGGFTNYFDSMSDDQAIEWAEKIYQKLPKCGECGELIKNEKFHHNLSDDTFCDEICASKNIDRYNW